MEDLHSINHSHCGELERLAAAAASMDYTESLSSTRAHNSEERDSQISVSSTQTPVQMAHSSRSTINEVPHVISYIDPYHVPKGHHLVPLRPFDPSQHYIPEHPQAVQSFPGSRIVMVAGNSNPITNIQFTRTASQYIVNDVGSSYQTEDSENCAPILYSQLVGSTNTQMTHYDSSNAETREMTQDAMPSLPSNSDKEEQIQSVNKSKKRLKRKANDKMSVTEEIAEEPTDTNNHNDQDSYPCTQCKAIFESDSTLKQHQNEQHSMPKRTGLELELKIEIIKRANAGEKKADLADEYSVNMSTIKSIMKKADSYLNCWKKGLFNPDSKRLKGPKREDVEEALYFWYKQAIANDTPVSGPILCAKAQDFARRLGHTDFKPTHGWLDRFKKRKKIVFGRNSSKRRREDKIQEPLTSVLPQILIDYESQDIFAVEPLGLCYRALPSHIEALKGLRCAGGVKSKERFSVVLCTNMTGSERFPLLVAGRSQKDIALKNAKTLPVHFIVDRYSWLTTEIISSWLQDMDSWFVQQGRKIILLVPPSPLYSHPPKLRALKLVNLPPGYPSPLRQIAVPCFKKYYRKKFLEELMIVASRGKPSFVPQLPILTCLQLLSSAWQSLTENVIVSSFQRAGLTKYCVWGMIVPTDNADFAGVQEIFHSASHILDNPSPPETTFEDFVHFDDDVQVCNLMGDDDILAKVKRVPEEEEYSDDDSGIFTQEIDTEQPSFAEVEKALGVLRRYVQYQEGAQEMFRVLGHLEYLIYNNVPDELESHRPVH